MSFFILFPRDREWDKETERHSCPAWQPLWKKAGPERETVGIPLIVSDCFTGKVLSACPPVLKLEWVAGSCILDKRRAAESCATDRPVRAEIWYPSRFCGSVGSSRDTLC